MKKYKITKNIEVSEDVLRKLIAQNPELMKPKEGRWRADKGGTYYVVNINGGISLEKEICYPDDHYIYLTGNYHQSKEEAFKYREKLLATQRVKDAIAKINKDWKPDWKNENQRKYYLAMNSNDREFWLDYAFRWQHFPSSFYIKDEESAEIIMRKCREDYRIMLDIE